EVTKSSCRDLFDRSLTASQACRVVISRQITDKSCDSESWLQLSHDFLQKRRLPRSRAGNQAHDEHTGSSKLLPQSPRDHIILLQDIPAHFDQPRPAHSSTSNANTSSSFP